MSEFQLIVPLFFIFQYLMNLVPGLRRDPSGRFSSSSRAVIAGTARGHGRLGRLRTCGHKTQEGHHFPVSLYHTEITRHYSMMALDETRLLDMLKCCYCVINIQIHRHKMMIQALTVIRLD